jgi:hypothetical protein
VRVLVVGAGGVGGAVAPIAARRDCFERILFSDLDLGRAEAAAARDERFGAARLDASDPAAIVELARAERVDAILNAADPRFNPPIFGAAFEAGCTYLDMAMTLSKPGCTYVAGTGKDGSPRATYLYHLVDNEESMRRDGAQGGRLWRSQCRSSTCWPSTAPRTVSASERLRERSLGPEEREPAPRQPVAVAKAEYATALLQPPQRGVEARLWLPQKPGDHARRRHPVGERRQQPQLRPAPRSANGSAFPNPLCSREHKGFRRRDPRRVALGPAQRHDVADPDVQAGERAAVHLDGAAIGEPGRVQPARVALARSHVENPDDAAGAVVERNGQRNQRVLHPEGRRRRPAEDEHHSRVAPEAASELQAAVALLRRARDLDRQTHDPRVRGDCQRRLRPDGVRSAGRRQRECEQRRSHEDQSEHVHIVALRRPIRIPRDLSAGLRHDALRWRYVWSDARSWVRH